MRCYLQPSGSITLWCQPSSRRAHEMRLVRSPVGGVKIVLALDCVAVRSRCVWDQALDHIIHISALPSWCWALSLDLSSLLCFPSALTLECVLDGLLEVSHCLQLHPLPLSPHLHAVCLPLEVQLLGRYRVQAHHGLQFCK